MNGRAKNISRYYLYRYTERHLYPDDWIAQDHERRRVRKINETLDKTIKKEVRWRGEFIRNHETTYSTLKGKERRKTNHILGAMYAALSLREAASAPSPAVSPEAPPFSGSPAKLPSAGIQLLIRPLPSLPPCSPGSPPVVS